MASPKLFFPALTFAASLVAGSGFAQQNTVPAQASVNGTVLSKRDGHFLNRASVVLKPLTAGSTAHSSVTDEKGRFSFPQVTPGRYELEVTRDGFLPSSTGWLHGFRFPMSFFLPAGASLSGIEFKLYPWGVITGHVTFEDAMPAVGAEVVLYRDVWRRARHFLEAVARTRTDDRGEYRIFGVSPGDYFVSAGWSRPAPPEGATEEPRRDASGQPIPDEAYAVTFYPSAQRLTEAVPVHLRYGDEANAIDLSLGTARTVRIRGQVTSGVSGQLVLRPAISLRRVGAGDSDGVEAAVTVGLDGHGGFEVFGVTPGPYYVVAEVEEDGQRLQGRRLVPVGNESIANVALLASPPAQWNGTVRWAEDTENPDLSGMTVTLEPRDQNASRAMAVTNKEGRFAVNFLPGEVYDVYLDNLPAGSYLASARSGGADLLLKGVSAEDGSRPDPMELTIHESGAQVGGNVVDANRNFSPGVNIDLVPDPPYGRYRAFQSSYTDEYGNFHLSGIPPGQYIVIAWAGEPPCDIYNPGDLKVCRAAGTAVRLQEGSGEALTLKLAEAQE